MARYPGTQFKVYDNSQTTATVAITNANQSDAVTYLTCFRSVKGPEKITESFGQTFYDRYGTQDYVKFSKYGQPLFQASMNINNGANLLSKRAVLDDATLANATVALALTKYKEISLTTNSDDASLIDTITVSDDSETKYSIAPLIFSIDNVNEYINANENDIVETKERYNLYKDYIINVVSNQNNTNTTFLNRLDPNGDYDFGIISGYSDSVYYNSDDEVIDDATERSTTTTSISNITCGKISNFYTIPTNYDIESLIINNDGESTVSGVNASDRISTYTYNNDKISAHLFTRTVTENSDATYGYDYGSWTQDVDVNANNESKANLTFDDIDPNYSMKQIVYYSGDISTFDTEVLNELFVGTDVTDAIVINVPTTGYSSVTRYRNDLMVTASNAIICEFVFPMFTIFDNGRGESIKTISIEFDSNSSKTLNKAVYTLKVYNYKTSKQLESYSFSLNPYEVNPSTGYTFDIESAVNDSSNQIQVKTYYDMYDALVLALQEILDTTSETVVSDYDVMFGHLLTGKFPTFSTYKTSVNLNRYGYTYDYAHLDIFDNDVITVNAYCDSDNMSTTEDVLVKYYFYNYSRTKNSLYEKLEYGSDGYCLSRDTSGEATKVPFIVISDNYTDDTYELIESTGQLAGTVIENADLEPLVTSNFVKVTLSLVTATKYVDGSAVDGECYLTNNELTKQRSDVYENGQSVPSTRTGTCYALGADTSAKNITVYIPYSEDMLYQEQYYNFFAGNFDRDIFNLDVYFPNAVFDANYSNKTKLAIQRLAVYRGDFMVYMDMKIGNISSYEDCEAIIPSANAGLDLTENSSGYYYVRDMHVAITCLYYDIRNPYDNKVITVTGTYGLSNLYIGHYSTNSGGVFAGISNGITISNLIEGTANYIPKIYPTNEMTSVNNIGGVYPSDDETIMNEKQLMCDLRVNYGCYYEDRFSIETEYTMHPEESEFSYWNNVALVCSMMQAIRKACPAARYQFITENDLTAYKNAVTTAMTPWKSKFASLTFSYIQDENALQNKIFYAAIEVVFKPFAQAEIFTLTALNYSTLSSTVTSV